MMTEDEARTKWCPHARVTSKTPVSGNRYMFDSDYSEKHAFATCIASECMAWRWVSGPHGNRSKKYGYCGLAGHDKQG